MEPLSAFDTLNWELQPNTAEASRAIADVDISSELAFAEAASSAAAALSSSTKFDDDDDELCLPPLKRQRRGNLSYVSCYDWTESEIDRVLAL